MADKYPDAKDTHVALRTDVRVREIEKLVKRNVAQRAAKAHLLKASGSAADCLTSTQVQDISAWHLQKVTSPSAKVLLSNQLWDRAMFHVSTSYAFRGDSLREIEWSDSFQSSIELHDGSKTQLIPALSIFANNSKTNPEGRVDEVGAIRNKDVLRCAIGAVALKFFAHFHILEKVRPSFEPDFSEAAQLAGFSKSGERQWYGQIMFPGKSDSEPMSYSRKCFSGLISPLVPGADTESLLLFNLNRSQRALQRCIERQQYRHGPSYNTYGPHCLGSVRCSSWR